MKKKKILLGYNFIPEGFAELAKNFELIYPPAGQEQFTKAELIERIVDVEVLVPNFSSPTDAQIMDAGKQLKLIANFGVGYNNIDVVAATRRGITVTNTPHSVLEPTAELCFALLLATARRIGYFNIKLHNKERVGWGLFDELAMPVYGQTLGIYGMGRIGQAVARRAIASGMKIIYHNRNRVNVNIENQYDATYVDFETLIRESDFLSLHAPATAQNRYIINADVFKKMKQTAILINTGRGLLVDEKALATALQQGEIYAAGLDVFENEPKITPELLDLDNVVLTPHVGTGTMVGRLDMQAEVAKNIINFFEGDQVDKVN